MQRFFYFSSIHLCRVSLSITSIHSKRHVPEKKSSRGREKRRPRQSCCLPFHKFPPHPPLNQRKGEWVGDTIYVTGVFRPRRRRQSTSVLVVRDVGPSLRRGSLMCDPFQRRHIRFQDAIHGDSHREQVPPTVS